jgi:predicted nuclease of predicted toxin-antitoxin system
VDAQLPPRLARWLDGRGERSALHVFDDSLGMLAAADAAIFQRARAAGAVVVTRDHDFVDMVERLGPPPAIVWVTAGNCTNAELLQRFERHWPSVLALLAAGESLVEVS